MAPWSAQGGLKCQNGTRVIRAVEVFFRPRRALRSKWVPEATLVDFGTPLGHLGRHFATHWGSQGSIFERILAAGNPFLNISTLQLSAVT